MRRAIIALLTLFALLANAAHAGAHASGEHVHDVSAQHHAHDGEAFDAASDDDARPDLPTNAEHQAHHAHPTLDRCAPIGVTARVASGRAVVGSVPSDTRLPSTSPPPLLEPPSA